MATVTTLAPGIGPIEPHVLYPIDDLKARSGLGIAAIRTMRRSGLQVRYAGGRAYVLGKDFIDYVIKHGKSEKPGSK
jgi:hypothetical protein